MHTMRVVLAFVLAGFASVSSANAEGRRGAVVVAATTSAVVDAKVLARAIYREPQLRPALDEATARAVLGDEPASVGSAKNLELARVARAAVEGRDPAVSVRLLRSLGDELGAAALVIVAAPQPLSEQPVGAAAPSPSARVFLVGDGRFLPLTLAPRLAVAPSQPDSEVKDPPEVDWSDAVAYLRSQAPLLIARADALVVSAPVAQPVARLRTTNAPLAPDAPAERGEHARPFLSSPWFWGGLAAVVAVGVTVLVLSQTALKPSDSLMLEGRIAP